jgi:hypothetical protein
VARADFAAAALAAGRFAAVVVARADLAGLAAGRDVLPRCGAGLRLVELAARFAEILAETLAGSLALLRFDGPVAPAFLLRADLGGFFADVIRKHSSNALLWRQGAANPAEKAADDAPLRLGHGGSKPKLNKDIPRTARRREQPLVRRPRKRDGVAPRDRGENPSPSSQVLTKCLSRIAAKIKEISRPARA